MRTGSEELVGESEHLLTGPHPVLRVPVSKVFDVMEGHLPSAYLPL